MTLIDRWEKLLNGNTITKAKWAAYQAEEKRFYQDLLAEYEGEIDASGPFSVKRSIPDLLNSYKIDEVEAIGLLDGINESLTEPLELASIDKDSEVKLDVDFRKLYKNMLIVKASWLSSLEGWNHVLSHEERDRIRTEYIESITAKSQKTVGRNDPCPCGSGKKYKKCCGR